MFCLEAGSICGLSWVLSRNDFKLTGKSYRSISEVRHRIPRLSYSASSTWYLELLALKFELLLYDLTSFGISFKVPWIFYSKSKRLSLKSSIFIVIFWMASLRVSGFEIILKFEIPSFGEPCCCLFRLLIPAKLTRFVFSVLFGY